MEEMEKLLCIWINEKQLIGDVISETIICEKAKVLHDDLVKGMPDTSAQKEEFKASRGWFENFKKRTGIHSVVMHGEAASSNSEAAEKLVKEFKEFVNSEGYVLNQVFNCDETGLFWKKMPRRTYISKEEKSVPGLRIIEKAWREVSLRTMNSAWKISGLNVLLQGTSKALRN